MAKKEWNKFDIMELAFNALSSILLPLAIASLGYFGNQVLQKSQSNEAKLRLFTEITSQREASESDLRKDMFNSIIGSFLDAEKKNLGEKVLELELLTYNFHESLNLKPLFVHLKKNILQEQSKVDPKDFPTVADLDEYLIRLEKVSRKITSKQMLALEKVGETVDGRINLKDFSKENGENQEIEINEKDLTLDGIKRNYRMVAIGVDFKEKEIEIRLFTRVLEDDNDSEPDAGQFFEFSVGVFDFPAIDNIRLLNDQRCAIVLNSFDEEEKMAEVSLVYFPGAFASLKEKPYYDEMLKKLEKAIAFSE